jgi:tetratricopeptide (TPR) repeat protein
MENPLEAGHEKIEELEELPESRLKTVITVVIVLVTILTTVSGVLAALWSARQSESQRARQQATAEAVEAGLHATSERSALDARRDDRREAVWRQVQLDYSAQTVESTSAELAAALRLQGAAAGKQADEFSADLPKNDDAYTARVAELNTDVTMHEQIAKADAQESVGWLEKHNGALAVVSILALSLFLLGLALTLGSRATQVGFTALSIVMTVVAGARIVQIAADHIDVASESCIDRFSEGRTQLDAGEFEKAAATLDGVVDTCGTYSEAYSALAQATLYQFKDGGLKTTIGYAQRALDTASAKSAVLHNDLGFVQTLAKQYDAAEANLDKALELDPENEVTLASRAELAVVEGQKETAHRYFAKAMDSVAQRGPYFRGLYFQNIRLDELIFGAFGITSHELSDFFTDAKQTEVGLDELSRPEPGDTHGATITDLVARPATGSLGKAGCATIGFHFTGFAEGDHVSIRFYQNGVRYEPSAGVPDSLVTAHPKTDNDIPVLGTGEIQPDYRNLPLPPGSQTMEIYLNGTLMGSKTFDMPEGTANTS